MNLLTELTQLMLNPPVPRTMASLYHELLRFALEKFHAARGLIALADETNLVFPARLDASGKQIAIPKSDFSQWILERVVQPTQPVLPYLSGEGEQAIAIACVPLKGPQGVTGALVLEYPPDQVQVIEEQKAEIVFFGHHCTLMIAQQECCLRADSEAGARQRAEDELRIWKRLVEIWPGSVLLTDADARVIYSNPHFSKVSGYSAEEIRRQPLSILRSDTTPEETFVDLWTTIHSGRTWTGEFCNQAKDGRLYWVWALVAPMLDGEGQISHFFSLQSEIDREKAMQAELERLSVTDPLTGVLNRGQLFTIGDQQLREAIRYDHPLTLLVVDINQMRLINERYGHQAGDQVLRVTADLLNQNLRDADVLGRLSGEEFAVLMPFTPLADGLQVAERLRTQAANLVVYTASGSVRFTISTGLAGTKTGISFSQMLEWAEHNLHAAKQAGA
jgi:diguanylate cyclase (GGDEF)-like protein/PAS domain S-box-containing protein